MVRSRPHILIVGANPAWQVTLHFETLCFGEVNRAYSVAGVTGGKGVNAATALKQLGTDCTVLQFAGGDTGERVCSDLHAREIAHQTVTTHSTTRTCTTLLSDDSGEMTELIEPSNSVNQEEEDAFQQYFRELVQDIDGVAICGTHPPGVHDDFYSSLIYTAKDRAFIVLDTYKNAKAAFAAGAHMLKINTRELTEVTGENDISTAAHCIFSDYPIEIVGVTAGSEAAYLFTRNHAWRFDIPAMGTVQNPLGAGDTMTAVLVARLTEEKAKQQNIKKADFAGSFADNLANVFREALATATASCITRDPARFSPDKVRELIPSITVNEL